jgi:hypothetical protein
VYSVRGKEAGNMKRYKVEMQREGSVKYFFIRDMETLEIVLLPSKYLMHQVREKCICPCLLLGISAGRRT